MTPSHFTIITNIRPSHIPISRRINTKIIKSISVKCILSRHGLKITEGLGHANTKEGRYARRWVTEKKLPEGIDKKSLQFREKEGKYGKYTEYLVGNDDPYTLANTVLKMAKKRSQVDAALTVASLSDIFTQDLEDQIPEESAQQTKTEPAKEAAKPAQKPTQKQSPAAQNVISQEQRTKLLGYELKEA